MTAFDPHAGHCFCFWYPGLDFASDTAGQDPGSILYWGLLLLMKTVHLYSLLIMVAAYRGVNFGACVSDMVKLQKNRLSQDYEMRQRALSIYFKRQMHMILSSEFLY